MSCGYLQAFIFLEGTVIQPYIEKTLLEKLEEEYQEYYSNTPITKLQSKIKLFLNHYSDTKFLNIDDKDIEETLNSKTPDFNLLMEICSKMNIQISLSTKYKINTILSHHKKTEDMAQNIYKLAYGYSRYVTSDFARKVEDIGHEAGVAGANQSVRVFKYIRLRYLRNLPSPFQEKKKNSNPVPRNVRVASLHSSKRKAKIG